MVDIGHGIQIPQTHSDTRTDIEGYRATLVAAYDPAVGRYRATSITIEAMRDHEVTSEMMRKIPVARMLALITESIALLMPIGGIGPREERAADYPATGPTDETLRHVAGIYTLAHVVGYPPSKAVAHRLGIPRSTATTWATRARDRGFLTVVDPRGRRGD